MEKLISKKLLTSIGFNDDFKSTRLLNEAKTTLNSRKKFSYETSIFLSHKHSDTEIIKQVITLLNELGVSVYVDWQDYEIPKTTDGSTATRIKNKIIENDKFILLATEDAINSKWCNWELGFGDASKFPKNIAVMPITNNEDSIFSGSEYLQIYPVITSEYYFTSGSYYVEYKGTKIKLQDWLKQK
ncbi:toll/interleukin-1 receptor domain-containing protein [Flavobacterium sp. UBA7663]|uniref:toll/interleukin-1 receptor domain-containing protein n=1 Tax=Flavobacterium sp. UBA7663 TaxID=1946557 RepID=UPI0025C3EDD4|nr:toll/interleukin-1 receptor domain-containing protein [Flavobacterium sp. UBA7663]